MDGDVKEFHLVAEVVKRELAPGRMVNLWGYNGSVPGPTIQINQGDRVRIIVDNHLPEITSMHWHGFEIPHHMDGAPGTSQKPIPPGGRFVYEFTLHQAGTFFYHSHMAMQEMMGMIGAFIMHPRQAYQPRVDKDFAIVMQEFSVLPNNLVPNSMNMEFNWLTFNGKSGPATTPLIVRLNDRVRIRLINLGMDHHPIHLHGHTFVITGTEGGRQPNASWGPKNTVLVGVAEAYDIEFVANNPGDWMVHCHLPHHMMNAMTSVGGPMTSDSLSKSPQESMPTMQHNTLPHADSNKMRPEIAKDANSVPGFPQDAFMEGPMMNVDRLVQKPETHALPAGWSQFMQGMMTFVRVLPPDLYDQIMAMRERPSSQPKHTTSHPNHGA
jgi:FtsP/CotA-like multicopper oxidase with cupredoxin domain